MKAQIQIRRRDLLKILKVSKEKVYELLINAHHYTPSQIANMTLRQVSVALKAISVYEVADERTFENMSDYLAWKRSNDK